LQDIVKNAVASGTKKLIGSYIPTSRNIIVKEHYKKLGFSKIASGLEIETWELDITNFKFQKLPMRFKSIK